MEQKKSVAINFSASALLSLIQVCAKSGVTSFEYADLKIVFGQGATDGAPLYQDAEERSASQDEISKASDLPRADTSDEQILDLLFNDPMAFEHLEESVGNGDYLEDKEKY